MVAGKYDSYADYVWQNRRLFPDVYGEEHEEEKDIDWDYVNDMQRDEAKMSEVKE